MTTITVRQLTADEWAAYREVRLAALTDAPDAFAATAEEERGFDEQVWRERMHRSARLLATQDERTIGVASVGDQPGSEDAKRAELFGLWVIPESRGSGAATQLVRNAMNLAYHQGRTHLTYWVSTDNGRAVAFASSFGFMPTDDRRPMRGASHEGEMEIMMVLPLTPDRGSATLLAPGMTTSSSQDFPNRSS